MRAGSTQIIAALFLVFTGASAIAGERQRAVLLEEDLASPAGAAHQGWVVWRTEQVKSADGHDELAIRAEVEIPDRKLRMRMSLHRNLDPTLSATHIVELTFGVSPDFSDGGITNVPGLLLKTSEKAKGIPLAALTVKVTDGRFLSGLLKGDPGERNLQLLRDRSWIDIPIVYANQHRAILAIDKGDEGQRMFGTVLDAWQKLGDNP